MKKKYICLGLMSGTSGDGVDASVIETDGNLHPNKMNYFKEIENQYYPYEISIHNKIHDLNKKVNNTKDLKKLNTEIKDLERLITLFHGKSINNLIKKHNVDVIGFHGHTIYHNAKEKISKQIGDANLLSQITQRDVVYNFRQNDIMNGGNGAPLTPVFHLAISKQKQIKPPWIILNIGGISNLTWCNKNGNEFEARDVGPGNCLIDKWVRENSNLQYDKNGKLSEIGHEHKQILQDFLEMGNPHREQRSYDINDFDLGFVRGLSLEDGAATITEYTAELICYHLNKKCNLDKTLDVNNKRTKIILTGGGRKNISLVNKIKEKTFNPVYLIDEFSINGDFVESQAFAFLSARTLNKFPLTYKWMTGCNLESCRGGQIQKFK